MTALRVMTVLRLALRFLRRCQARASFGSEAGDRRANLVSVDRLSLPGALVPGLAFILVLGVGCEPTPPTVTVWHATGEAADSVLQSVAQEHEDDTGTQVQVRRFSDRATLLDSLQGGQGSADVFIGTHTWKDRLQEHGLVDAYCPPDGCEICQGDNPPEWCKYAKGDFSHGRIDDMVIGQALCTEDQCPQCFGESPPDICKVMSFARDGILEPNRQPDFLQASFVRIIDEGVFPLGIPIWWNFPVVGTNPDVIEDDHGLATRSDVLDFASEQPDMVYTDPVLGDPIPAPFEKGGTARPGQAAVIVTLPNHVPALRDQGVQFEVLPLEDYRPSLLVTGGYVHAETEMKEEALNVLYRVADEGAQERFYEANGQLPAHAEVLDQVAEGDLQSVVRQGTAGIPLLSSGDR